MKLKRFVAKDMREALVKIKDELGPDAVIMSNKRIDDGVEIVAGVSTINDSLTQKVKQVQRNDMLKDRESLEQILKMAKARRESRKVLADDSVFISSAGATRALDDINASLESLKNARQQDVSEEDNSLDAFLDSVRNAPNVKNDRTDKFANSLVEILERQQNDAKKTADGAASQKTVAGSPFQEPPPSLSENSEFDSLFKKSRTKLEKEQHENESGIDTYRDKNPQIDDTNIQAVAEEVQVIRKLLQFELAGLMQESRNRQEPVRAMIERLLVSAGFDQDLSSELVSKVSVDASFNFAWRELSDILEKKIIVGNDEIVKQGGVVSLIGPAGVGKTTTLAKIAARFVMRYGPDRLAIVTADHYRIGAFEQVKTYGRIMGCAAFAVKSLNELPEILYTLRDKSLVLVDTAGVGLKDERFGTQIAQLKMQSSLKLKHYLVLPATAHRRVLTQAYNHFSPIGISGLILTKVDESQSLGDAISLSIKQKLPLTYATDGQRVPEDLFVPKSHLMAIKALSYVEDDVAKQIFRQ